LFFDVLGHILEKLTSKSKVCFSAAQLKSWPDSITQLLIDSGILQRDELARIVRCDSCPKACFFDVEYDTDNKPYGTCVGEEINDPIIPIPPEALVQWQASHETLSIALSTILKDPASMKYETNENRWLLGHLEGDKQNSRIYLSFHNDELTLSVQSENFPLADYLFIKQDRLAFDTEKLINILNKMTEYTKETPDQRHRRALKIVDILQNKGVKNYVKLLAKIMDKKINNAKRILHDARKKYKSGKITQSELASMVLNESTMYAIEQAVKQSKK
jgi:hypothetical protein